MTSEPCDTGHLGELLLPVMGVLSPHSGYAAHGGQAVLLTRDGAPALVVLDVESFAEWAEASATAP